MRCAMLAFFLAVASSFAQEVVWVDANKKPVPDVDARKSVKGFGAMLVVTPDADWEEKWYSTPHENVPTFSEADRVTVGQTLTILGFFTNPGLTDDGKASISCSIRVVRPDNSVSIDQDFACFEAVLPQDRRSVFLLPTAIKYVGEETDPLGTWLVEFTISDQVRQAVVPLKTSFTLQGTN